ncbi:hypothetical protein PENTCL1PPCAC_1173, partial [Pristionchus entomophagus]
MIYDVATFIRIQQVERHRTGPWITFGGSNPGALSVWTRQWFPDLVLGVVSSSAPLQAKNDFYEYLEVVGDVINRTSPKCHDRTGEAFDRIRKLSNNPDDEKSSRKSLNILWTWQTCNEFGYYQTTDYGRGIFGTALPLNYFIIICERVFGVAM